MPIALLRIHLYIMTGRGRNLGSGEKKRGKNRGGYRSLIFSLGWVSRLLSLFVIVIVRLLSFLFALASNNGISSKGSKDSPFVVVDFDKRKKEDLD